MLTIMSTVKDADTRGWSVPDACLPASTGAIGAAGIADVAFARPRADSAPVMAGPAIPAGLPLAQFAQKQYAHTTRIVAPSGGLLGSHPAREPEPA
ncbi:MAG: hypothetical protein ACLQDY_24120 [Streptosporangiaceae bacterium]